MNLSELKKIIAVHKEANQLLHDFGLLEQGWTFKLSNTKKAVGRCVHSDKVIEYSKWFLDSSPESVTDTLLHEIAHALVGASHGHDWTWKSKAMELGCDPSRVTETAVTTAKFNYVMKCPECNREWKRYRMKRSNHGARCPVCHVQVKIYRYVRG